MTAQLLALQEVTKRQWLLHTCNAHAVDFGFRKLGSSIDHRGRDTEMSTSAGTLFYAILSLEIS